MRFCSDFESQVDAQTKKLKTERDKEKKKKREKRLTIINNQSQSQKTINVLNEKLHPQEILILDTFRKLPTRTEVKMLNED